MQQTKEPVTRRIIFCVSSDLAEILRERAWEQRKTVSKLVRDLCERTLLPVEPKNEM